MSKIVSKNFAGTAVDFLLLDRVGRKATFTGPNHTDLSKDMLILEQIAPTRKRSFAGSRRFRLTHIQSHNVTENGVVVVRDSSVTTEASFPVGGDLNKVKDSVAFATHWSAVGDQLVHLVVEGRFPTDVA